MEGNIFLDLLETDGSKSSRIYECDTCLKSYNQLASLYRHKKHECGKQPHFYCPFCPHMSKRKDNFNSHMIRKHANHLKATLASE
ncbi:hypothetical protein LSTR_LSTR001007 [Laodelphax striatellus]|uniref:C2H2-type domain-containing protein n=1 Tax=Laodelphax striatellus TaxID=195883 RepID=A0A482X1M9_LAOST|nr:hypothetical protein LSTR_LSTR001007 [Laodelphax striatellus]